MALLVFTGHVTVWHVVVLGGFLGVVSAFDITARQAFVVDMIEEREDLPNAIALNSFIFNGALLIGPAVAGILIAGWFFYMAFEAYHTAKRRAMGELVDEFSSLVPLKGRGAGFPVLPVVLIAVGTLFLLNNLDIIRFYQIMRYWPVFLIALGVYLLYARMSSDGPRADANPEASHEQQ